MYDWHDDYYRMTGTPYCPGPHTVATMMVSHQIRFMRLWRKSNQHMTIWRRILLLSYGRKYGLEISYAATIGRGLYLGHPYNITVGADVIIGNNCNLHKGCTIGRENRGSRQGTPIIGDRVSIGINATVVGNIRIGDDVLIAPNSFVNFDVPSHSVVIGNPGIIHPRNNATEGYIGFTI